MLICCFQQLMFFSFFFVFFFFNDTATTEIYTYDTLFPSTTLFRSRRQVARQTQNPPTSAPRSLLDGLGPAGSRLCHRPDSWRDEATFRTVVWENALDGVPSYRAGGRAGACGPR